MRTSPAGTVVGVLAIALLLAACTPGPTGASGGGSSERTSTPSQTSRPVPIGYTGVFSPTGSMSTARDSQTATLLADSRVLIVGGESGQSGIANPVASAELYDPVTGTFTSTGSMTTARDRQTATLLSSGRVLVIGGAGSQSGALNPIASAELYDPRTGSFSPTGSMSTARDSQTATLLADGRVLIVGGVAPQPDGLLASLATAEVYDPRTGTFSSTGSMSTPRSDHTATLLPDGRVLIAGGYDFQNSTGDAVQTAELYDPRTGTFSQTGSMSMSPADHTATLLADGRVLIVGADESSATFLPSAELYDPGTGTFTPSGSKTTAPDFHTATLLTDGRVLIAGGEINENGVNTSVTRAELYDPLTSTFVPTGPMAAARGEATAILLADGRVLLAGGTDDEQGQAVPIAAAELFR